MPAYAIRSVGAAALALGLVGLAVAAPGSDTPAEQPEQGRTKLSPDALRDAASEALRHGDAQRAFAFSDALVNRDGTDRTALLIRSRSARDLGNYDIARTSARSAWKLAETSEQKYASSLVMAQALSSAGNRTRAQLWLRRAAHHAPDETLENRAIRDFRYVKSRNPLKTQLSFSVSPNSNINNGTKEHGESILNLGASRPLSGLEYSFGVNTQYRFRETQTRAHDLTFSAKYYHYSLSDSAKRQQEEDAAADPAIRIYEGKDFAFGYYEIGYAQKGKNFDHRGEFSFSGQAGHTWYGGDPYTQYLQLNGGQRYKLNNGHDIGANLTLRRNSGITTADTDEIRASLSYGFATRSGSYLRTSLGIREAISTHSTHVPNDEFREISLSADYWFGQPILGASANLGLSVRQRVYDDYLTVIGGTNLFSRGEREDRSLAVDFTLTFREIDYYGFNPTMTVSAATTNSNQSRYNIDRFGVNFGIRSAF